MADQSRRQFLKTAGLAVGGAAIVGLVGCSAQKPGPAPDSSGSSPLAAEGPDTGKIDKAHQDGVKAFPAKTAGQGLQPLTPKIENGVKVFELTAEEIEWEVSPGKKVKAMAYNSQVPGPVIRVTEGDKVRIIVKNNMKQSTAVHWHGLRVPLKMDGVPYITQDPIPPGGSYTYEFEAKTVGTHMYHSHHNAAVQIPGGLLGPFIVDPRDKSKEPAYDREYFMVLNDGSHGFTINGKGFPATQPYTAKRGERLRFRFLNEGSQVHPMHLHGYSMQIFARDGYLLPQPFTCDTLTVAPGERWDAIVIADEAGVWAFHCHVLPHAESEHGMHGMVTALIVE